METNTTKSSNTPKPLHTILGAGQIGPLLAKELVALGHSVRIVRRGAPFEIGVEVEWVSADITDAADRARATVGSAVIYHCMNPADYSRWPELLPPLYDAVASAAEETGAHLVVLENLYQYGATGIPMTERSGVAAKTIKGMLRAQLSTQLKERSARGGFRLSVGRASDFIGPDADKAAIFGERLRDRMLAGKSAELYGPPALKHSYSYTVDVAKGLAALGTRSGTESEEFILPTNRTLSTGEWIALIAAELGADAKQSVVPAWFVRAFGLINRNVSAFVEMLPQWSSDYVAIDDKFVATFGFGATPPEQIVQATVRGWSAHANKAA